MRIGDKVAIRVGRERRVAFGVLTNVFPAQGVGTVRVRTMVYGRGQACRGWRIDTAVYVRDLKRIKPAKVGVKERHAQQERDKRRQS